MLFRSAAAASAAEREAARQEAVRTEAARRAAQKALVKTFIPPEVKRSPTSTQTLIQPLSPPDLIPPPTVLPSFRVVTPQFPKLSRRFVAPGRTTERPPAPTPQVETPDIQLAQVTPVDLSTQPKLPLPVAPPPPCASLAMVFTCYKRLPRTKSANQKMVSAPIKPTMRGRTIKP